MRLRILGVAFAVLSLLGSGVTMASSAAASGTLYPSGYVTWAYSLSWSGNCWIGPTELTGGNYITAVQRIATGNGCSSNGVDGTYGTYTRNAIECFRRIAGLTVDGTVGTSTWNELNDPSYLHIDYCNTGPYPFCYYYAGYLSGDQLSQASNGPGYWYTMNIADTSWVAMDTGGPA